MFVFGQQSWPLLLAAIIATWVIINFAIVVVWVALIEINGLINDIREDRATNKLFKEVEEIQNDFI